MTLSFIPTELPEPREDQYVTENYGIVVEESIDKAGAPVIRVVHIAEDSPLTNLINEKSLE